MNRDLAIEIREHLHPWDERTIYDDAARWIRGEPWETEPAEGEPRNVFVPGLVPVEMEGRPYPFWR